MFIINDKDTRENKTANQKQENGENTANPQTHLTIYLTNIIHKQGNQHAKYKAWAKATREQKPGIMKQTKEQGTGNRVQGQDTQTGFRNKQEQAGTRAGTGRDKG